MVADKITPNILCSKADWYQFFVIGHFDKTSGKLTDWFPENPSKTQSTGAADHIGALRASTLAGSAPTRTEPQLPRT